MDTHPKGISVCEKLSPPRIASEKIRAPSGPTTRTSYLPPCTAGTVGRNSTAMLPGSSPGVQPLKKPVATSETKQAAKRLISVPQFPVVAACWPDRELFRSDGMPFCLAAACKAA